MKFDDEPLEYVTPRDGDEIQGYEDIYTYCNRIGWRDLVFLYSCIFEAINRTKEVLVNNLDLLIRAKLSDMVTGTESR